MLDNFAPQELAVTAATLKAEAPHVLLEASGGITDDSIEEYMCPGARWMDRGWSIAHSSAHTSPAFSCIAGIDVISTSWIHQGVPHVDFSLKIQPR